MTRGARLPRYLQSNISSRSRGASLAFDAIILTVPCSQVARLCPTLSETEKARLRGVTYQGTICAALLLKRPLAGYYVTNITDPGVPFTAVVEMTALVNREAFGGHSLVYLPRYVTADDPLWERDDASITAGFLDGLKRMYPSVREDDVAASLVSRVREMLPVPMLDYSSSLAPSVGTSLPNVFVVNSAQIVNGTLNVNETIGLGEAKALELERHLGVRTA